jgi:hypothetical protein
MTNNAERRLVGQICLVMRLSVIASWLAILTTALLRGAHPHLARGAFSFFRIVAVLATLWLIAGIAEAVAGRASFRSVTIDVMLTLPMFVFWFLVFVLTI